MKASIGKTFFAAGILILCLAIGSLQAQSWLRQRAGWTNLDPGVVSVLERRMTTADLKKFVEFSEKLGLVQTEFLKIAGRRTPPANPALAIAGMAVLFTNLANNFGQKGDLPVAGKCAATALKLNSSHVPAMLTLIQINLQTKNCPTARSLISLARTTLARLTPAAQKRGAPARNALVLYGEMSKQLDVFERQCR